MYTYVYIYIYIHHSEVYYIIVYTSTFGYDSTFVGSSRPSDVSPRRLPLEPLDVGAAAEGGDYTLRRKLTLYDRTWRTST